MGLAAFRSAGIGFGNNVAVSPDGHQQYDVTGDDQRFVMMRSMLTNAGESVSLITVDNYTQELLEKVGGR